MKFSNKNLLITGGTGSFGRAFAKHLIDNYNFNKIIIFSRDELKQFEMQSDKNYNRSNVRFFIGDVRDKNRLQFALRDVDYVVHAAALKQILTAEYNPFETIRTNVVGSQNLVEAAIANNVKKVIVLSTDKACSPLNLYGASKLCSEKIFLGANTFKGNQNISFSAVRYGNVDGSRGSVMPFFINQKKIKEKLTVTDLNATRFSIEMKNAIDMVLWGMKNFNGGEILIPKLKSYRISDLVKVMKTDYITVGLRDGEKLHEDLINESESRNCIEVKDYYILSNSKKKMDEVFKNLKKFKPKKIKNFFNYNSDQNKKFLTVKELSEKIKKIT